MTNITPLYWEASDVSLHTLGWSINTRGGSRMAPPSKRGEDFSLPLFDGTINTRKFRGPRPMDLPMWIAPLTPDGREDPTMSSEAKMYANWDYVLSLFDQEGQIKLTKRLYAADGTTVLAADAWAELLDAPEPDVIAYDTLGVTISLMLADPYFYRPIASQPIGTINVEGNAPTDHVTINLAAGSTFTGADGNWIKNNASGTAVIDVRARSAKVGSQYVNGKITRNTNFLGWPKLVPGSNVLSGSGTISYEAAYK